MFVSCTKHHFGGGGTKYRAQKRFCSNTLKRYDLKVYISLEDNKLGCLANSQGSFHIHDLVHDFLKKYHEMHISLLQCTRAPEISNKAENYVPIFSILSALRLP